MYKRWFFVALLSVASLAGLTACSHATQAPPPATRGTPRAVSSQRPNTMTIVAPANYTEHSYRGKPDLGLTLAIVQAGGGPAHFESGRLFQVIAGTHAKAESAKLEHLYGKARMAAFMQTFTYAVHDLLALFAINHIDLPQHPSISPHDGPRIATAIYQSGVMPTGQYDCGYMMEHLMTHPVHIVLMHDINVAHGHGPTHNANFHIILTRMIADLRNDYRAKDAHHAL
jgi:hypothetical protein